MLAPADKKRLEGRVGLVQGRWNYTRKLTVYFPDDGGRSELRILSVDPSQLERASSTTVEPEVPSAPPRTSAEPPGGNEKLSQEDNDNLFG